MGKKKAAGGGAAAANIKTWWCYYCDTRHEDEYKLIQHQRSKHFLCRLCDPNAYGRNCLSLSGLVSHTRRSHRKEIKEVPNAVEGRESLEVEVSAMNGIPQEALDEFNSRLAAEQKEAGVQPQEVQEEAAPPAEQSWNDRSWREAPPPEPQAPEEPPALAGMGAPSLLPMFADMAKNLALNMNAGISEPTTRKEEPMAFDPAMLAARLKAAQDAQKRHEEDDDHKDRRAVSRSRSRDAPRGPPPEEDGAEVQFDVTGKLGMAVEPDTGIIADLVRDGKAEKLGVKAGWQIISLDGDPYTPSLLQDKGGTGGPYRISFCKKAKRPEREKRRPAYRPERSRSRKPAKGSLKFRPRSMNRSEERKGNRDDIDKREKRGMRSAQEDERRPRDDARREAREDRKRGDRDDDRDDRRGRRDSGGGGREERRDDRRDDRGGRDDRRRDDDRAGGGGRRRDDDRQRDNPPLPEEPAKKERKSKWGPDEPAPQPPMPDVLPMSQMMSMGTKTEMCMAFTEGLCTKGDMCVYAHSLRELAPGGYKPRLCPSFMRGGCPRMGGCLYAHTKEELPPQFKCIMCRNYTSGHCRKAQICTLAHGAEEQKWFMKFMGEDEETKAAQQQQQQQHTWTAKPWNPNQNQPKAPGMVGAGGDASMADNVMAAAENQLMQGVNLPGQLAIEAPKRAPLRPSYTPKLNLAANPALKAPGAAMMQAAGSKAMGMPPAPPGMMPPMGGPPMGGDGGFPMGGAAPAPKPWRPTMAPPTMSAPAMNINPMGVASSKASSKSAGGFPAW